MVSGSRKDVPDALSSHRCSCSFPPEFYRDALVKAGQTRPDGMGAIPEWSLESALRLMDKVRIGAALLSISSPGIHFGDDAAAARLARKINEEGTRIRTLHPDRFGLFAVTPLPNVEMAIAEVEFALDQLGAEGVVVESNHHGMYHGHPKLEPFYAELNKRKAAMFIHPTSPACEGCLSLALGYPRPMLEFMFETTRTVTNLILHGVTRRYPDIRMIVPHGGAALAVLASRVDGLAPMLLKGGEAPSLKTEIRRLYFDLAGAPLPEQLEALLRIADPERILYGSDWPFTPDAMVEAFSAEFDAAGEIDDVQQRRFMFENALKLFPGFRKAFEREGALAVDRGA